MILKRTGMQFNTFYIFLTLSFSITLSFFLSFFLSKDMLVIPFNRNLKLNDADECWRKLSERAGDIVEQIQTNKDETSVKLVLLNTS